MHMTVESVLNGEHPLYRIDNFDIYLDGEKQTGVYSLDTLGTLNREEGYVVRYVKDDEGFYVIDGDEVKAEIAYGNVEIKLK